MTIYMYVYIISEEVCIRGRGISNSITRMSKGWGSPWEDHFNGMRELKGKEKMASRRSMEKKAHCALRRKRS